MISILIALSIGLAAGFGTHSYTQHVGWSSFAGFAGFLLSTFLINRFFAKKLQAIFNRVQNILEVAQLESNKFISRAQTTGKGGSPKMLQKQVEKIMSAAVKEALDVLDETKPLYKWILLCEKNVDTTRMQLYYQLKDFTKVDTLLPNTMMLDPLGAAMKMARQYKNEDSGLEKTYKKARRKFKGEKVILIYSTYAWILLKQDKRDEAQAILNEAREKTESEDLERNFQAVANNRTNQFSNSFLGEQWYGLQLEEQKTRQKVSKGALKNNPLFGGRGGKRRYR